MWGCNSFSTASYGTKAVSGDLTFDELDKDTDESDESIERGTLRDEKTPRRPSPGGVRGGMVFPLFLF